MIAAIQFGAWDVALLAVVSVQATMIAYLHQPRWKVLALSLPLPFTLASLALGEPVGATHMAGVTLMLLFVHAVRVLHVGFRLPIVPVIAGSAAGYCLAATGLARVIPKTDAAFWVAAGVALAVAAGVLAVMGPRDEPGHRSPLPVWIKLPVVAGVIGLLIVLKQHLSGFMTMFPMVGVITAYEARKSLWTVSRQMPVLILAFVPMIVTIRLLQGRLGLGGALPVGWAVLLTILVPLSWRMWFRSPRDKTGPTPTDAIPCHADRRQEGQ